MEGSQSISLATITLMSYSLIPVKGNALSRNSVLYEYENKGVAFPTSESSEKHEIEKSPQMGTEHTTINSPISRFQITESMSDRDEKRILCPVPIMIIGGFYT